MNIGEQIKKYRKEAGLSQKELGERLGVSQQHIAQYESGKRIPKIETINNIAGALGIGTRRLYPDFSYEEWKTTETYKKSVSRYYLIKGLVTILEAIYDCEIEVIENEADDAHSETRYSIKISDKVELQMEDIDILIDFIKKVLPAVIDIINHHEK